MSLLQRIEPLKTGLPSLQTSCPTTRSPLGYTTSEQPKLAADPATEKPTLAAVEEGHTVANPIKTLLTPTLLWLKGTLAGHELPMLLDSGATICCIAQHCVKASPQLKSLFRKPYIGSGLLDANGEIIMPSYVITAPVVVGSPSISLTVSFVVIKSHSCIIGTSLLNQLKKWSVDNEQNILQFNEAYIPVSSEPPSCHGITLIAPKRLKVSGNESTTVLSRATGNGLSAFRPITNVHIMTEGNEDLQKRLGLLIQPSIHIISKQNCTVPVRVFNHGSVSKTIGKGSKLACCLDSFVELPNEPTGNLSTLEDVNTPQDPIKILSAQMTHLPEQQFKEATMILESYRDVFTIGNAKIGCTNITEFDINTDSMSPISAPLQWVPIHQQEIVKELLEHYQQLGLIEPYDSPYRAATVLVKKKNVAESQHVTDQYRLCVDYRFLNSSLSNSGWPAPLVSQCLDAAHGSTFISAIDFNSGYHQIPCTDRAKTAVAFSPGYGFRQWTWNVMPQGIKPASNNFQ